MIPVTIEARDFAEIKARLTLYEVWRASRLTWSDVDAPEWAPSDDERNALAVYDFVSSLPGVALTFNAAAETTTRGKAASRETTPARKRA